MFRFIAWSAGHPRAALSVLLVLTGIAAAGVVDLRTGELRLRIDASTESLIIESSDTRAFYEDARQRFGSAEPVILALSHPDLLASIHLERVVRLTRTLERLEGVRRVISLSTALDVRGVDDAVVIAPFMETIPQDASARDELALRVRASPLHAGTLLSDDGATTAVLVYPGEIERGDPANKHLVEEIVRVARGIAGPLELAVSGIPYIKLQTSETLIRGLKKTTPFVLLILGAVLVAAFRSPRGLILPLASIGIALAWTLGTMGWLGYPLNLVTAILPPLVLTVGFAYAMHVVAAYVEAAHRLRGRSAGEIVRSALYDVNLPLVITAFTTMAGLLSLAVSRLEAIRQFGLFAVLGVLYAAIVALTFIPAVLAMLPPPESRATERAGGLLRRAADRLSDFAFFNRRAIIRASLVLFALMGVAMLRIEVGTDYIANFPPDSQLRRDYQLVNEKLGGVNSFQIVLRSPIRDAFLEPDMLRELRALQIWLEAQPEVGSTSSIADYLMLLNRALHDGDPAHFAVPESRALASQLLLMGASREAQRMLDARGWTALVSVRATEQNSAAIEQLVERIDARLARLPTPTRGRVTGSAILLSEASGEIARGQLTSLALSVLIIYAVLSAMFTSLRIGLVALLPNALPIAVYFGVLGITGVALGPSTSLVACIALGIAVDDTIHYFARFNRDAKSGARDVPATKSALRAVIHPVTYTSVALCLGFGVLMTSEMANQVSFGALAALTLAVAWGIDLTLTPALCSSVRIVTLWDVLGLDLGQDAQREIEFFEGLSIREARIVALMGSIEERAPGDGIELEGELAHGLYVVLGGDLSMSVEREGVRTEVATIRRGGVVGATEFFAQASPAEVEVVTPARVMRFTHVELDRLRSRYPRIASTVYRNLNRIQAESVAGLLEQVAVAKVAGTRV